MATFDLIPVDEEKSFDLVPLDENSEPVKNPMGDAATPADVIRNAAMGRIDRVDAENYLKSVGMDASAIDMFGKNAKGSDVLLGLSQKPAQGMMAGFGEEVASRIAAPLAMVSGQLSYDEAQKAIQDKMRYQQDVAQLKAPVASTVGEIGGAVAGSRALASAAPKLTGALARATSGKVLPALATSAGLGAVSGGVYGLGTGEGDLGTRAARAEDMGILGGIFGTAGGAAGRYVGPLTQKALSWLAKRVPSSRVSAPVAQQVEGAITRSPVAAQKSQPLVDAGMTEGSVIPLTKGQRTGNPKLQALESTARRGGIDEAAQSAVLKSDYKQQDAIKKALYDITGGEVSEDSLIKAGNILKQGYKDIKSQVGKAYDDADMIRGVFVDKKPISEVFAPKVNEIAKKQGFDLADMSQQTQKLISQLDTLKDNKITGVNLEKMEFWRRKLTNRIEESKDAFGKMSPEGVMLSRVRQTYDDFMNKLPEGAIKSGDSAAISAIQNATALRKRQGVLFESNKVINNIVKNDKLTNEELANMVMAGSESGKNIGAGASRNIKAMRMAAGDNAEELIGNVRKGVVGRMLSKSMDTVQRVGEDVNLINPNKLSKNIDDLLSNRSLVSELFDKDAQNMLFGLAKDLRKIRSVQPGSVNYSNTAYHVINFLRGLPIGLSSISAPASTLIKPIADKAARDEVERSVADVIGGLNLELIGKSRAYGAVAAGGQAGKSAANSQKESK